MHETQDFRKEGGGGVIITVGVCGEVWGCVSVSGGFHPAKTGAQI